MIRTVVAVLLTVAIIGAAVPALERGAATNSENIVERQIQKISEASISLSENERVPPEGASGPQRTVTVTFPDESLRSDPMSTFRIERHSNDFSVVHYRIEGRTGHRETIDAPIVNSEFGNTTTLGGTGERDLRLELRNHNETSVVVLSRA